MLTDYGGVGCWQTTGKSDAGRLRGVSLGRRGAIDGGGGGSQCHMSTVRIQCCMSLIFQNVTFQI